jgi:hypothetical protein
VCVKARPGEAGRGLREEEALGNLERDEALDLDLDFEGERSSVVRIAL